MVIDMFQALTLFIRIEIILAKGFSKTRLNTVESFVLRLSCGVVS